MTTRSICQTNNAYTNNEMRFRSYPTDYLKIVTSHPPSSSLPCWLTILIILATYPKKKKKPRDRLDRTKEGYIEAAMVRK